MAPYRPAPPSAAPVPAGASRLERLAVAQGFAYRTGEARPGLLGGFDLAIVRPAGWSAAQVATLRAYGTLAVAELSATRLERTDPLYPAIPETLRTRVVGPEARLDMTPEPAWFALLLARKILPLLDEGYDGICLTDLDLAGAPPEAIEAARGLLAELERVRPDRPVLVAGNAATVAALAPHAHGLLAVGLHHAGLRDPAAASQVASACPKVFALEYADLQRFDRVGEAYAFARSHGFAAAVQADAQAYSTSPLLPPESGRGHLAVAAHPADLRRTPADARESAFSSGAHVLFRDLPAGTAELQVFGRTLECAILPGRTTLLHPAE